MVDITYRCIYPDGSKKEFENLPDPPKGFHWRFESYAYCVKTYALMGPPVKVVFDTGKEKRTYLSTRIPPNEKLPKIPSRKGYFGYWDIPKRIYEPLTLEPSYISMEELRQFAMERRGKYAGGLKTDYYTSPFKCPRCGSELVLCQNHTNMGYFTACSKHNCPFHADPQYFFEGDGS